MKEKNFKWLLNELSHRKERMNILDVSFCTLDRLRSTQYMNSSTGIKSGKLSQPTKIKHFMMNLLEKRSPKLQEFAPEKVICIIDVRSYIRALTVNDIIQMTIPKINSLKIASIHTVPAEGCASMYKIDFNCQIRSIKKIYGRSSVKSLQTSEIIAIAYEQIDTIQEFIFKVSKQEIRSMTLVIMIDNKMSAHLLKSSNIALCAPESKRKRLSKGKNIPDKGQLPRMRDRKRLTQFPRLSRSPVNASAVQQPDKFIELLAKTIDKDRKLEHSRLNIEPLYDESKYLDSLEDLIEEIESTRPKLWSKDIHKRKPMYIKQLPNLVHKKKTRERSPFKLDRYKISQFMSEAELRKEKRTLNSVRNRIVSPLRLIKLPLSDRL